MAGFLKFASPLIDEATIAGVADVLRSGHITSGVWVERFEAALSEFVEGRPVRALTSATAAVEVALQLCDIGRGDEVITCAQSFFTVVNMIVKQGDVEDWIIENRSLELHAFHIHQLHFLLTEVNGAPVQDPFLRDTVNVGFWEGKSPVYPSVKLRMDFRNPEIVGTFVYHCHILEHKDGGMMGSIRVLPGTSAPLRAHATAP